MATPWTPERRARQAELISNWKPWEHATGPRTPDGKAKVGRNAYKGGDWLMLRNLSKMVNDEIRQARELVSHAVERDALIVAEPAERENPDRHQCDKTYEHRPCLAAAKT